MTCRDIFARSPAAVFQERVEFRGGGAIVTRTVKGLAESKARFAGIVSIMTGQGPCLLQVLYWEAVSVNLRTR